MVVLTLHQHDSQPFHLREHWHAGGKRAGLCRCACLKDVEEPGILAIPYFEERLLTACYSRLRGRCAREARCGDKTTISIPLGGSQTICRQMRDTASGA